MMDADSKQFLKQMLTTPSPSGYEQPVQQVVRDFAGSFADAVETDWHGNVNVAVNPSGTPRIMLAGHCDQIGMLVNYIDENGFIWVSPIGGWDVQMLIGQRMQIWTADGPVLGVIARKAIHLLTTEERKTVPEIKDLWLDIGASSQKEAQQKIAIGDPVTLYLECHEMQNELMTSPGIDNKVGTWVVTSAAQRVKQHSPTAAVFAVSTVQEEVGLRGVKTSSFAIDPQLGIAVDVTHATDCPTIEQKDFGQVSIGAGPVLFRGPNVNPVMFHQLQSIAQEHDIPIQINGLSKAASNDGNALQINRSGVATAIIGIPNRYMHSPVEMASLADLDHAAELIAQFCLTVSQQSDFTP